MSGPPDNSVTQLLSAIGRGEPGAREKLLAVVYERLRAMARGRMANEAPGHVLQTTALVHEAYLRLFGGDIVSFENRRYCFAAAAESMRRILIDDARKRDSLKRCPRSTAEPPDCDDSQRGKDWPDGPNPLMQTRDCPAAPGRSPHAVPADQAAAVDRDQATILDVDAALERLDAIDPEVAEMVKQYYFLAMTIDEIAEVQGVAPRTVDYGLRSARALLRGFLTDGYG